MVKNNLAIFSISISYVGDKIARYLLKNCRKNQAFGFNFLQLEGFNRKLGTLNRKLGTFN